MLTSGRRHCYCISVIITDINILITFLLLFTTCDDVWNIKNIFLYKDEVKINCFHEVHTQNFLLGGEGS